MINSMNFQTGVILLQVKKRCGDFSGSVLQKLHVDLGSKYGAYFFADRGSMSWMER